MTTDEEKMIRARAETLWNELDDTGRATLLEELEELADLALTKRAEDRKGGSIPHLWYRMQWLARSNDNPARAFVISVRGG